MHIWHGLAPAGRLNLGFNPQRYIKRVIISQNLSADLDEGRTRNCTFSKIFLANPFLYQKKYQIVEPFTQANCFPSSNGRKRYIKALLHPASYLENCSLCGDQHKDICNHLLASCRRIPDPRRKLRLKLTIYNYPPNDFPITKEGILKNALDNKGLS